MQPWFYPNAVSGAPGERVKIHASSPQSPCKITVTRVGLERIQVAEFIDIEIGDHPTPEDADQNGCGWPVAFEFVIGDDWKTGYYDLCLTGADGSSTRHYICVRNGASRAKAKAVIILNTNTYAAYNYWGGSNAYANVTALMTGQADSLTSREGAIARLSRMRPYPQNLLVSPEAVPRLVNLEPRGVNQPGIPGSLEVVMALGLTPYDGSAGFVNKWEHHFTLWSESEGYDFDYVTDHDFEDMDNVLDGYSAAFLIGHSEYWSGRARVQVDRFTKAGGNLTVLSGNTSYWKVRWEDEGETMIVHKTQGENNDPLWKDSAQRKDATHLWSHPDFSAPEAEMTGLSFLYGGYHRLCMCVARGGGAYTVYNEKHWALEGTDLYYGDMLGGELPLIGYENDGCIITFNEAGLPVGSGVGVPDNLEIIAFAPATLAESETNPFPPMIPREDTDVLAKLAYGKSDPDTVDRLMRGHAVMASFKREQGEVFNAGTTEWAYGLKGKNPFVEKITHNVLDRFGVIKNKD